MSHEPVLAPTSSQDAGPAASPAFRRNARIAALPTLLVPVAYIVAFHLLGIPIEWGAFGIGALGWVVALLLRNPIALALKAALRTPERVQPWIVLASGPCEELTRLAAVLLVGRAFAPALSLGLGWAAIEVVYTLVNQAVVGSLMMRTDEKARRARELLAAQGADALITPNAPLIGIYERVPASAIHMGFALLIAWQPWLVVLTLPLHSATNVCYLAFARRRSAVLAELVVTIVGAAALLAGFALFGHL